jgi:hypothetical protein
MPVLEMSHDDYGLGRLCLTLTGRLQSCHAEFCSASQAKRMRLIAIATITGYQPDRYLQGGPT